MSHVSTRDVPELHEVRARRTRGLDRGSSDHLSTGRLTKILGLSSQCVDLRVSTRDSPTSHPPNTSPNWWSRVTTAAKEPLYMSPPLQSMALVSMPRIKKFCLLSRFESYFPHIFLLITVVLFC